MALEQLRSRHASEHDDLVRQTMEERERADDLMVRLSMKEQSLSESRAQNLSLIARIGKQQRDAPIDAMLQKMQLDAREGTIRTLRSELAQANRLNGLGPLPEPASPAMLRQKMERRSAGLPPRPVTRPTAPLRVRLEAVRHYARLLFGLGWLWALALIVSTHAEGIMHFMSMPRPAAYVQRILTRGLTKYENSDENKVRAFLTRLVTIVGRKRWEKQRRALKYLASIYVGADGRRRVAYTQRQIRAGMFQVKQIDDMCSRADHEKARSILIQRYAPMWEADCGPIEVLKSEDGSEVGAYVDVYGAALTCVKSGLEHEKYHDHVTWVVRQDEHGPYLYVLVGDGCDEYPRNRRNTATEGSLSNRFEYGAACSPERQFPYLSVDCKETGYATGVALAKKEAAVARLRASLDPSGRIKITVKMPPRASSVFRAFLADPTDADAALDGETLTMRCAVDYLPLFDIKHHAFCNRNSGPAAIYGGIMYSVDKDHLCLPEARLMTRDEYLLDEDSNEKCHYFLHDKPYIAECVAELKAYMDKYRAENPGATDLDDVAKEFCKGKKHSWWQEKTPFEFMDLVFFCVLHLDTNLCAVWLELYEAYSLQLASVKGFEYSDEASPHRKFHKAMDAAGLEPIAKRLRNRVPPEQDPQDFRALGPHAINAMKNTHLFDDACKVENESEAEKLERNTIKTMALMHRGISAMHSKFTMEKSEVPLLVEMGRYMMRLVKEFHLPRSYNLNYMCLGNPQLLELHMERFVISDLLVFGLQSLGCAQGPEAFHHDSGIRIPMQTSGRPGCHYTHLQNAYLLRLAAPRELSFKFDPHSRNIHRIDDEVREGHCRSCSGLLPSAEATPFPTDLRPTNAMVKGFMMLQPLCPGCARDVSRIMVEVCSKPGGIIEGSIIDGICSRSNFVTERQTALVLFSKKAEKQREKAAAHFEALLKQHGDAPTLDETLGDLADDNHDDSADQSSCYLDAGDDDDAAESSAEADGPVAFPNLDDFLGFGED